MKRRGSYARELEFGEVFKHFGLCFTTFDFVGIQFCEFPTSFGFTLNDLHRY